jgi:uncharacterized protein (DUF934 family)
MATLIKERRIVADSWHLLKRGSKGELPEVPARGDVIVPLALWLERREDFLAFPGKLGVWVDANEGPEALAGDVQRFPLIAVNFPKFGDGRGYSIARLLRERYGYKGELRAVGQITRDQLFYLEHVGFNAYVLREGEDPVKALSAFNAFSASYQRR